jgi:hypothetical protein
MATQPQPTPARRYLAGASTPLTGPEEAELRARLPQDGNIYDLDRRGWPLTRENYIRVQHGCLPPDEEWSAEHEEGLPREFWLD